MLDPELDLLDPANGMPKQRTLCPNCLLKPKESCYVCRGSGKVCPDCRNAREVRQDDYDPERPSRACPTCTDPVVDYTNRPAYAGKRPLYKENDSRRDAHIAAYDRQWLRDHPLPDTVTELPERDPWDDWEEDLA